MKNQLVKINQDYSFELLASLLSELEFEHEFLDLENQEFQFKDAVAVVSGSILLYSDRFGDVSSANCDFEKVSVYYDSEIESELSFTDRLVIPILYAIPFNIDK